VDRIRSFRSFFEWIELDLFDPVGIGSLIRGFIISRRLLALAFMLRYGLWYDVFFLRFIPRNLKRNCSVCLMCIKLGFVNFVDVLTTMSSCIEKCCIRSRYLKIISRDITLELILQSPIEMAFCYYCKSKGFICFSCFFHSDRCFECVCDNQSYCDVWGLSIF